MFYSVNKTVYARGPLSANLQRFPTAKPEPPSQRKEAPGQVLRSGSGRAQAALTRERVVPCDGRYGRSSMSLSVDWPEGSKEITP